MSKKGGSFLGQQGHSKLAIASLFEAIYIYIYLTKGDLAHLQFLLLHQEVLILQFKGKK